MGESKNIFLLKVDMRKIEGTEHDYELVTTLNDMYKTLSSEAIDSINEISEVYVNTIKEIIRLDELKGE